MTYTELDVIPDSPEWYEKRREGLGASDSAAILRLSKWATSLDVYKSKNGVERAFDPMKAWLGHEAEGTIGRWIEAFHPELGRLRKGMAAQSGEWPWLFATPDAFTDDQGLLIPVEKKTSNPFARDEWKDDAGSPMVPLYYEVQVQQQIAVMGAPYGWLAVWHGGTDFELHRIERDNTFIEQLVRITGEWWTAHVVAHIAPDPSTYAEALEAFPGVEEETYALTQEEFDNLTQRDVDASDMNHTKKRVDAFKDYIAPVVGNATVLTFEGRPMWSYKRQNGAPNISDAARLKAEWPDAWEACITVPRFPVLRRIKREETK